MTTIKVNVPVTAVPREMDGGGYWAEVKELPGCVAQAETLPDLEKNLSQAVLDWLQESPEKTEDEARRLAEIQGRSDSSGAPYPQPNPYLPPPDWVEEDD